MSSLRSAIASLSAKLEDKQRELRDLSAANQRLRVRAAALQLLARVMAEAHACRAEFGAGDPLAEASEREQLEVLLAEANGTAAPERGSAAATSGAASGSTGYASAAAGPGPRPPAAPPHSGSELSGASSASGSAHTGASGGAGAGAAGGGGGGELLAQLPHLQAGNSLLHVAGTPPEVVAQYVAMDTPAAMARWRDLVEEALVIQAGEGGEGAHDAELADVAVRMYHWKNMLLICNGAAFKPLSYVRYDSTHDALHDVKRDALPDHWREAMFSRARLRRLQAQLIVELYTLVERRVERLREERAELSRRMDRVDGASAPGLGPATHDTICRALEANSNAEWAALVLMWLVMPTVFEPHQWAKFISSCWPFPADEKVCCQLLKEALEKEPHRFADFRPEPAARLPSLGSAGAR